MLEIQNLKKVYGSGNKTHEAIGDVTFSINEGELASIVGPSGCGKTTLLKCMSGLLDPTSGSVTLDGIKVTEAEKRIAVVFQEYSRSLYPWKTVRKNVEFPLRSNKSISRSSRDSKVLEAIEAVGLESAAEKYPWELSGGMQQRVAIARAIAYEPSILLMDEPFASVDAQTRADLEDLTRTIQKKFGTTIAVVTHDIDESIYLADRVIVLGSSPTKVLETITIDLPAERDQISTKEIPEFAHLRARIHKHMKRAPENV